MKHLRQYIRRILQEVYELDDEQRKRKNSIIDKHGYWYGSKLAHAAGLEDPEDQVHDRFLLSQYQDELDTSQGRKLVDAFVNGKITILHSMTYEGATSSAGLGGDKNKAASISSWIKSYGKKGNDTLSTVAYFGAPTDSIQSRQQISGNSEFVLKAKGVILKGYPVFVGEQDVFSHTVGAIDDKMKSHWKNSGIPKRPNRDNVDRGDDGSILGMTRLGRLKKKGYSSETLLDNWTVIGTYINVATNSEGDVRNFVKDSLSIGIPCNVYDPKGKLLQRHEP